MRRSTDIYIKKVLISLQPRFETLIVDQFFVKCYYRTWILYRFISISKYWFYWQLLYQQTNNSACCTQKFSSEEKHGGFLFKLHRIQQRESSANSSDDQFSFFKQTSPTSVVASILSHVWHLMSLQTLRWFGIRKLWWTIISSFSRLNTD